MGRYSGGGSYGHNIRLVGGDYLLSWTVDHYYSGSRLRFPRTSSRFTDRAGAERFSKRWGVKVPTLDF